MHFLPRPGGSGEDDGVLVTIVFDGPKEQVIFWFADLSTPTLSGLHMRQMKFTDDSHDDPDSNCNLLWWHRATCFCSTQKPSDRLTEPTSPTISPGITIIIIIIIIMTIIIIIIITANILTRSAHGMHFPEAQFPEADFAAVVAKVFSSSMSSMSYYNGLTISVIIIIID